VILAMNEVVVVFAVSVSLEFAITSFACHLDGWCVTHIPFFLVSLC
jgi:hypothetical protein